VFFEEEVGALRLELEESDRQRKRARDDYGSFLRHARGLYHDTPWAEFEGAFKGEAEFRAVGDAVAREMFDEYIEKVRGVERRGWFDAVQVWGGLCTVFAEAYLLLSTTPTHHPKTKTKTKPNPLTSSHKPTPQNPHPPQPHPTLPNRPQQLKRKEERRRTTADDEEGEHLSGGGGGGSDKHKKKRGSRNDDDHAAVVRGGGGHKSSKRHRRGRSRSRSVDKSRERGGRRWVGVEGPGG